MSSQRTVALTVSVTVEEVDSTHGRTHATDESGGHFRFVAITIGEGEPIALPGTQPRPRRLPRELAVAAVAAFNHGSGE